MDGNAPTILLHGSISARSTYKATQFVSLRMCWTWMSSWSAQDRCRITSLHYVERVSFNFVRCAQSDVHWHWMPRRHWWTRLLQVVWTAVTRCIMAPARVYTRQIAASAECGGKTHHWSSKIRPHHSAFSCPAYTKHLSRILVQGVLAESWGLSPNLGPSPSQLGGLRTVVSSSSGGFWCILNYKGSVWWYI